MSARYPLGRSVLLATLALTATAIIRSPNSSDAAAQTPKTGVRAGQGWIKSGGQWSNTQELFDNTCGLCHTTGTGPELRGRDLPEEYTIQVVREGLLAMPSIRKAEIDDAELAQLATWLKASRMPAGTAQDALPAPGAPLASKGKSQ